MRGVLAAAGALAAFSAESAGAQRAGPDRWAAPAAAHQAGPAAARPGVVPLTPAAGRGALSVSAGRAPARGASKTALGLAAAGGGSLGFVGGATAGTLIGSAFDCTYEEWVCEVWFAIVGGTIGQGLGVPLGVHLADGRLGRYLPAAAASVGLSVAGLGLLDATHFDSPAAPVIFLLTPVAQAVVSVLIERATARE